MESLVGPVTAVLDEYTHAWSARDLQRVADLWDDDPEATYVAEELGEVLVGRERIAEHLLRTENRLTGTTRVDVTDVSARELAEGLVLASFVCRWQFDWVTYSRVGVILRRRGPRWRFVHYMESPFHLEEL